MRARAYGSALIPLAVSHAVVVVVVVRRYQSPFPLTIRVIRVIRGKKPLSFAVTILSSVFIRVHPWQKCRLSFAVVT